LVKQETGGEKEMRKMLLTPLIVCSFALLLMALMPTVAAKTLKFEANIAYNDYGEAGPHPEHPETEYWMGEITIGDVTGTCYFWETPRLRIVGKVEHFFEDFNITFADGWISGYDNGVWNFATFKFRASGRVTDASSAYADWIGCKFFEIGNTNNPFDPEGNILYPIIGTGRGFIGP
jgi:hypothetical protein